jgi:hypothetical protein
MICINLIRGELFSASDNAKQEVLCKVDKNSTPSLRHPINSTAPATPQAAIPRSIVASFPR